jgi:hypothetical protein
MTRRTLPLVVGIAVLVSSVLALLMLTVVSVEARSDLTIPSYGVVRGAEGSTATVGSVDVPASLQGLPCQVELIGQNNESTHPDNDLTVKTGTQTETFTDIESVAFGSGQVDGTMVLGGVVVLTLTFGPDGVTSGGYAVNFDCEPPATTTTSTTPSTTTPKPPLPPTPPEHNPPVTTPRYTG